MWFGAVWPRGNDGLEGGLVGAEPAHLGVEGDGHLGLRRVLGQQRLHVGQRLISDGSRGCDTGDFTFVLPLPQPLHEGARGHQFSTCRPGLRPPPLLGPADVLCFQAQPGHTLYQLAQ